MVSLKERASEIAFYLQRLKDPAIFSEVQSAVKKKDESAFIKTCKKVKIPKTYIAVLMTVLFTTGPTQWPWPPP